MRTRCRKNSGHYLERHGCLDPVDVDDMLAWDHEGGFSLDASVCIEHWDSNALERLTRYCARPPFSSGRLGRIAEHTVSYNLPRPTSDGRICLLIDPMELLRSAGPSPALLERLKNSAACMGIHDQDAERDTPGPNSDAGIPKPPDEPKSQ